MVRLEDIKAGKHIIGIAGRAPVVRAEQKPEESEALIPRWASSLLRMKLDELLWRERGAKLRWTSS